MTRSLPPVLLLLALAGMLGLTACVPAAAPATAPDSPLPDITLAEIRGVNYVRSSEDDPEICPDLHYEADPLCPWRMDVMRADMDRLQAQGVNTLRIFLNYYIFGAATLSNPEYSMDLALTHLDDFIAAANERGMYVMPILMAKYPQYRVSSEDAEIALSAHVRPLLQRYANHPGIIAWDMFNEPDIGSPVDVRCWDWANEDFPLCVPLANERLHFLRQVSDEVQRLDPDTPVTISMAFAKNYFQPTGTDILAADLVDFFAFHYYDDEPYDSGRYASHWYYGEGFPRDLERALDELRALDAAKPIVITELGFPTGPDASRSDADLRRDLETAMQVAHREHAAGIMLWPFQPEPEHLIDDLFDRYR